MQISDVDVSGICEKVKGKTIRLCLFSDTYDGLIWTIHFEDGSELEINDIYGTQYTDKSVALRAEK